VNEDLAATACWGTQQAHFHGENKHDGVFAIWYGKGPGVDRTGDAFPTRQPRWYASARRCARADGRRPHVRILDYGTSERVRAGRRDDSDPQPGWRAGAARLRHLWLGLVALLGLLGRSQVDEGHDRRIGDGGRESRACADQSTDGLCSAWPVA
jgi:hypothetical protein